LAPRRWRCCGRNPNGALRTTQQHLSATQSRLVSASNDQKSLDDRVSRAQDAVIISAQLGTYWEYYWYLAGNTDLARINQPCQARNKSACLTAVDASVVAVKSLQSQLAQLTVPAQLKDVDKQLRDGWSQVLGGLEQARAGASRGDWSAYSSGVATANAGFEQATKAQDQLDKVLGTSLPKP
jgi:hypothetical protein